MSCPSLASRLAIWRESGSRSVSAGETTWYASFIGGGSCLEETNARRMIPITRLPPEPPPSSSTFHYRRDIIPFGGMIAHSLPTPPGVQPLRVPHRNSGSLDVTEAQAIAAHPA